MQRPKAKGALLWDGGSQCASLQCFRVQPVLFASLLSTIEKSKICLNTCLLGGKYRSLSVAQLDALTLLRPEKLVHSSVEAP